jgi:hypothetical protein
MSPTTTHDADPDRVLSIIMGGGQGTRLFPLTRIRGRCNYINNMLHSPRYATRPTP